MCRFAVLSVFLTPLLLSCGSFVPVAHLDKLSAEERQAVRGVAVFSESQLDDLEFEILDILEGNSCKNKFYDAPATRTDAIEQLKYYAHEMGADGIANIRCSGREGTSVNTNCWELISCTAEAIRLR